MERHYRKPAAKSIRSKMLVTLVTFMVLLLLNLHIGSAKAEDLEPNGETQVDKKEEKTSSITDFLFKWITSIQPSDARSFLGRELPGLAEYDTEIVVAGEGTDLTNLPYESSPPLEVLLKEQEVAEDQLEKDVQSEEKAAEAPLENSVFIYHTHNLESFLPLLKETKDVNKAFTSDERANVVGLGQGLANRLIKSGIGVHHDRTNVNQELLNRKWKYTASYKLSSEIVKEVSSNNPDLRYYIDIHRDSARRDKTTKEINGKSYARLYFIIGKENKDYHKNLAFAEKLHAEIEKRYPGLSRGVFLKNKLDGNGVYNQDVSDRAILVELGGVDNSLDELNRTMDAFSEVFADLYWEENGGRKE